jgi:hypothetical protein
VKGFSLLLVLTWAAFAFPDDFDVHCANFVIMQDRRVQAEIGIPEKQRTQMNKFADVNRQRLIAYKQRLGNKAPDRNVLDGYLSDLKKNILGIMTPQQIKRLRELNLQAAGLLGLLDKVVATKIGLTGGQYAKFTQIYEKGRSATERVVRSAMLPIDQKYQKLAMSFKGKEKEHEADLKRLGEQYKGEVNAAQQKIQPQIISIRSDAQNKLMAMLTPQEKAIWAALKGKLFVLPKN